MILMKKNEKTGAYELAQLLFIHFILSGEKK